MKAPERMRTERLVLRRPTPVDAEAIFQRYASDPDVTRYLAWPRHRTLADTRAFLQLSAAQWEDAPAGPYLIESRDDGGLLGSTGLAFDDETTASTGYVLAKDAWGKGYATEALSAMVALARDLGVTRLYALCHAEHVASRRVLEKCSFVREDLLCDDDEFPNLAPEEPRDLWRYAIELGPKTEKSRNIAAVEGNAA